MVKRAAILFGLFSISLYKVETTPGAMWLTISVEQVRWFPPPQTRCFWTLKDGETSWAPPHRFLFVLLLLLLRRGWHLHRTSAGGALKLLMVSPKSGCVRLLKLWCEDHHRPQSSSFGERPPLIARSSFRQRNWPNSDPVKSLSK